MDGINLPLSLVDGATTVTLLVLIVMGFVTDRVVSGKRLRDERALAAERLLEERTDKKEYADIVKSYGATLEKLLAGTETTNQILRSLPHPTDKDRP